MAAIGRVTDQTGHFAPASGLHERDTRKGLHQVRDVCDGMYFLKDKKHLEHNKDNKGLT